MTRYIFSGRVILNSENLSHRVFQNKDIACSTSSKKTSIMTQTRKSDAKIGVSCSRGCVGTTAHARRPSPLAQYSILFRPLHCREKILKHTFPTVNHCNQSLFCDFLVMFERLLRYGDTFIIKNTVRKENHA